MRYSQNVVQGAVFILLSELMFASMGAAVKSASGLGLPNEMLVFMRNLMGLFVIAPLLLRYGVAELRTPVYPLHLMRALLGLSAMYCFFYVLGRLPLADGLLLKMTSPIFMPLIALFWLGERVARMAVVALPIGFIGVVLVLKPGAEMSAIALLGVLGGALAAVAKVTVRRLSRSESTTRTVFYFSLNATLISALPLVWAWQMPTLEQWALLGLMGVMGTAGQLLLTRGYGIAPAARVSPFTYFSVVFGAAYGYLFWGEVLDGLFVFGAMLIAVAGVMAVRARAGKPVLPSDTEAT